MRTVGVLLTDIKYFVDILKTATNKIGNIQLTKLEQKGKCVREGETNTSIT